MFSRRSRDVPASASRLQGELSFVVPEQEPRRRVWIPLLFMTASAAAIAFFAMPGAPDAVRGFVGGQQARENHVLRAGDLLASLTGAKREPEADAPVEVPVNPYNKHGIYLAAGNAADANFFGATVDALRASGGSAVIIDVKGPFVYLKTDAAIASEIGVVHPLYDLASVVRTAHAHDLYTIVRFVSLKDPEFAVKVPDVHLRNPQTGESVGEVWVDGAHPTTLEFNRQILHDVFRSGVDEVNFDYIRYPTEYAQEGIGLSGAEKSKHVIAFLKMARAERDAVNPKVKLGISTYAITGWMYAKGVEWVGQDFVAMAPYVDVISPMAYPDTFDAGGYYDPERDPRSRMYFLVYRTITGYRDLLPPEHRHKLRPWIQGYAVDVQDVQDEIDAVYDAGACGYTVWNAANRYDNTFAAMKSRPLPLQCH